jgi:uncharacterized protein (TIGR03435 family)
MKPTLAAAVLLLLASRVAAQPQFEVAQVKPSEPAPGRAWERITTNPGRLTASGVTLKQLIFEAYDMPYYRIFGGPSWLESEFYDVAAKAESPVDRDQLRLMLRGLLADRFRLTVHRETKELRAYVLTVAKNGPKLHAAQEAASSSDQKPTALVEHFHCDLTEFADLLSLRLNMPMTENQDPTVPVRSTGVPPPVLNKTGIEGVFDISVEIKLDGGADAFIAWQRALQDQLGLKLESQKGPVEVLVIDHAEKIPLEI